MSRSAPSRRILLLHQEPTAIHSLGQSMVKAGFTVVEDNGPDLVLHEFVHAPCLILASEGAGGRSVETLTRDLKSDPFLGRLPLIVFIRDIRLNDIDWGTLGVDDYITVPDTPEDVVQRVRLCLSRLTRSLDANPLTHLPGNTTIPSRRRPESKVGNPSPWPIPTSTILSPSTIAMDMDEATKYSRLRAAF